MSDLLSVLVGGAIGIIAGVAGPYFIQRVKEKADKREKRADKLEELIGAVIEHYHWFAAMRYFFISGQENQPTLSPIIKIEAIAGTHFPEFGPLVQRLNSASNNYEIWILDTGQKRLRNEPGYEKLTGHDEVLTNYTRARDAFIAELRNFARRELNYKTAIQNH
jgi:hypothetical protein